MKLQILSKGKPEERTYTIGPLSIRYEVLPRDPELSNNAFAAAAVKVGETVRESEFPALLADPTSPRALVVWRELARRHVPRILEFTMDEKPLEVEGAASIETNEVRDAALKQYPLLALEVVLECIRLGGDLVHQQHNLLLGQGPLASGQKQSGPTNGATSKKLETSSPPSSSGNGESQS